MGELWETLESWTITHGGSTCQRVLQLALAAAKREAGCLRSVTGNDVRIFMLTCMRIEFGLTFDVELRHAESGLLAVAVLRPDSDF